MDKSWPPIVYFRPFLVTVSIIQIEKSLDGVLGIQTWGCRIVGADKFLFLIKALLNLKCVNSFYRLSFIFCHFNQKYFGRCDSAVCASVKGAITPDSFSLFCNYYRHHRLNLTYVKSWSSFVRRRMEIWTDTIVKQIGWSSFVDKNKICPTKIC